MANKELPIYLPYTPQYIQYLFLHWVSFLKLSVAVYLIWKFSDAIASDIDDKVRIHIRSAQEAIDLCQNHFEANLCGTDLMPKQLAKQCAPTTVLRFLQGPRAGRTSPSAA